MIDRQTVDRIFAAANIVEIIGDYVTLKRKGANYQACCPFHQEKTPSFVVSPAKGFYKCFGCGKGGNAVTFIMEQEGISYPEALKVVAKRYGIQVEERELTEEDKRRQDNRESMFALNAWAEEYFVKYMSGSREGQAVGLSYFSQKRGFTDATIRKFGLGFCSQQGDAMTSAAMQAGYKEEFLLATGLTLKREADGRLYDRFRDRVIFPIHNISGRVVGFGGRTLRTDGKVAKYQNSPESEIYIKKRELYGLYFAKKAIQQNDAVILVEGYADVISMHQQGVENVVASSGTSLTVEQVQLLHRFTHNITIIYDGDAAGQKAALRGIDIILKEGMNVRVVLLPEEDDPDTFARKHTAEQVQEYIRSNEVDFLSFKARLLMREAGNDPIRRGEVIKDMVRSIVCVQDNIQRSVFTKECARIMDVDENMLISEVARGRLSNSADAESVEFIRRQQELIRHEEVQIDTSRSISAGSSEEALENEIVKYLLKSGHKDFVQKEGKELVAINVAEYIFSTLNKDNLQLQSKPLHQLYITYYEQWQQLGVGVEVPPHHFVNHASSEVCNVAVDLLTSDDNYVASELWRKKDVHIESEDELLTIGVPKVVMLYQSKVLERLINIEQQKLNGDLTEEEELAIIKNLNALNNTKLQLAKLSKRLIL